MQVALLILSFAATVLLPLIFFLNLKRLKPWLGFCLLLGAVAFLILDFVLADAVMPGLVDTVFGFIQLVLVGLGLGVLWFFGFRNMIRLLGIGFWLWLGAAVILGGLLGLLSSGSSPLDQFVAHSQLFGDCLQGVLGAGNDAASLSVIRMTTFIFILCGLLSGFGLGLGGKSANRRTDAG